MVAPLLQAVFLPIVLAPAAYVLGRVLGRRSGWFSFALLLYATWLLIQSATQAQYDHVERYAWHEALGTFGLRVDGLSLPFALTIYLLATVLSIYSMPYMQHRIEEQLGHEAAERSRILNSRFGLYYALYLIYAAGMIGAVLATNLLQFYIFFEIMLIPSFFLIAEFGYGDRIRIAFLYFIWTHIGALVLLAGILTAGLSAGTFDFALLQESRLAGLARTFAGLAITAGLFVKLAAFGLHIWLPHAHAEAPTPISALLSPAMIGIGGYALIRLLAFLLPSSFEVVALGTAVWGVVTMVYGGMMALAQDDLKRLLAYSSVSQMGYLIFGIASAHYLGIAGSAFHYVSHGTGKAILFMVAGALILQTQGIRSLRRLGGLAGQFPVTATAAMIGFLAIIGIPPANGFISEFMLFSGAFQAALASPNEGRLFLSIVALASTPLTAGYTLLAMKRIFFGPRPEHLAHVREAPLGVTGPLLTLAVVTLLLGIYPSVLTDPLVPYVRRFVGG